METETEKLKENDCKLTDAKGVVVKTFRLQKILGIFGNALMIYLLLGFVEPNRMFQVALMLGCFGYVNATIWRNYG